ncbi:hypothetical protein [Desulforamulus reducens]|uniref:hypothetical protein n=1 Tax=Desulforamulus reducens TaxID=59610 RepID=UPI00030BF50D|nr:hypothetical protein [Desulforamulus reducens]
MASIARRPNGKWQATIYMGRDENGKQIRRYVTGQYLKEVKRAARAIEMAKKELK